MITDVKLRRFRSSLGRFQKIQKKLGKLIPNFSYKHVITSVNLFLIDQGKEKLTLHSLRRYDLAMFV